VGAGHRPDGYPRLEHRRPYATKDGHLCVLVYNKTVEALSRCPSQAELMADSRFCTQAKRASTSARSTIFSPGC